MIQLVVRLILVISLSFIANVAHSLCLKNIESSDLMSKQVVFKDTDELIQIALDKHLGSQLRKGSRLKQVYGRYIYRVSLLDNKKIRWNVDFDAQTGEIISNMID